MKYFYFFLFGQRVNGISYIMLGYRVGYFLLLLKCSLPYLSTIRAAEAESLLTDTSFEKMPIQGLIQSLYILLDHFTWCLSSTCSSILTPGLSLFRFLLRTGFAFLPLCDSLMLLRKAGASMKPAGHPVPRLVLGEDTRVSAGCLHLSPVHIRSVMETVWQCDISTRRQYS